MRSSASHLRQRRDATRLVIQVDADRCRALASAASCSALVTTMASGPGYTVVTWSPAQRTTYGGEPSLERTSTIIPRCSCRSTVVPFTTSQSPTFAFIARSLLRIPLRLCALVGRLRQGPKSELCAASSWGRRVELG